MTKRRQAVRNAMPDGTNWAMDDTPGLWQQFNVFYGTLWTDGVLDQATKEVGRLRNARVNDCGL
jgi:hypothetical protein